MVRVNMNTSRCCLCFMVTSSFNEGLYFGFTACYLRDWENAVLFLWHFCIIFKKCVYTDLYVQIYKHRHSILVKTIEFALRNLNYVTFNLCHSMTVSDWRILNYFVGHLHLAGHSRNFSVFEKQKRLNQSKWLLYIFVCVG